MNSIVNSEAWKNLREHCDVLEEIHIRDLFAQEGNRFHQFSLQGPEIFLDFSKNRVLPETMNSLIKLAETVNLNNKIEAMFTGQAINFTEHRAVLHTALRNRSNTPIMVNNEDIMPKINGVLNKMRQFTEQVHSGKWRGNTGKKITDVVNIGIGGSDLGPKMVVNALAYYAKKGPRCHFVSNVDGTQITEILESLDPETTLFIVASKTFTTIETLTNAETARDWLLKKLKAPKEAVAKHFVAVSTNAEKVKAFGIDVENMFEFWDWVGGRYSVWSAIGLPIALSIGMDKFEDFLAGAHEMDQHFYQAKFDKNIPVILGLLSIFNHDFLGAGSEAVIPYDQYLFYLVQYLQQLSMESNGKTVTIDGEISPCRTGAILWGGIGTDGQHAFHQLLHQGTELVAIDFIIPIRSLNPTGEHHVLLMANCLAQAQALMCGRSLEEVREEMLSAGIDAERIDELAPYKVMPGNQPVNMIMLDKLTPRSLGALLAMYEHKTFVIGAVLGINSFDQWGVELGKKLAGNITDDLIYTEHSAEYAEYDDSTKGLIEYYRRRF
ncbi:MAG: glucose-6-phosphate isomerase [Gammaproteobacteria bacterium]|jgi:glucose-6-phosphate isomerase